MATTKTEVNLSEEMEELKRDISALKDSVAQQAEELNLKDLRHFLTQEAKRLGFERGVDMDALRAEGARAARMVRRRPGTSVGLVAAIGFCAGLLVARR